MAVKERTRMSSSKMAILLLLWNMFIVSTVNVHGQVMADEGMYPEPEVTSLVINGVEFSSRAKPPIYPKSFFLGGAGEGGLLINGQFVVYNAMGIYLDNAAVPLLAGKWKGKSADELATSDNFFHDIYTGTFNKFTRVSFLLPLTGPEFSQKLADIIVAESKAAGTYDRLKVRALSQFLAPFKDEDFRKGSSVFFTHFPIGAVTIAFSSNGSIPKANVAVVPHGVSQEILQAAIGKNGVSPAAKRSLAVRMAELFDKFD